MKRSRFVDRVLHNADIRTQDDRLPRATAVAIGEGRILAVGQDHEILPLQNPDTSVEDMEGRLILPGFMDSHFHFDQWAIGLQLPDLSRVRDFDQAMSLVAAQAERTVPGGWVVGLGFNEGDWKNRRIPDRHDLDRITPYHPVLVWRCDLHLAVANTRALELAGVTDQSPDPPEGIIVRDSDGSPNGVLREGACHLVSRVVPRPSEDELIYAMQTAIHRLHGLGLTGLHDVRLPGNDAEGAARTFWALQRMRSWGNLPLRMWFGLDGACLDFAVGLGLRTGFGDECLRVGHVKYFADGGMGARTAWMIDPYLDAGHGMPLTPVDDLERAVIRADRAGLAVMIHAIGERANREVIGIFEKLQSERSGPHAPAVTAGPSLPHRIEHVQMIRPEDIDRLGRLGIPVSVQPSNMVLDINMLEACVAERSAWTYPFRDLLDAGVPVMISSDCPVCDPNPLMGIHAAATRQRLDNSPAGGWHPNQKLTVDEAVRCLTIIPAYAYRQAGVLGSVGLGKRADMIVLDTDIYSCPPEDIHRTQILRTIFGGLDVHRLD